MTAKQKLPASKNTIGRLSLYRRLLDNLAAERTKSIYSHELAGMARVSPAQVRRDLMTIGYSGSPIKGYVVRELIDSIGAFLGSASPEGVILAGIGNLGQAVLAYFDGRQPRLAIAAAFDNDPQKVGRVINGCHCYSMEEMPDYIFEHSVRLAIVAVPTEAAQNVADMLVRAGITGILNFAPIRLDVPECVYVEDNDITMSLEKVAYFSGHTT